MKNRPNHFLPMQTQHRYRPLPWQLQFVSWIVVITQLYSPYVGYLSAQEARPPAAAAQAPAPARPAPVLTPTDVKINRTEPRVTPPSKELKFSADPADNEFFHARVFAEPIVALGRTSHAGENKALARALIDFRSRSRPDDCSALENFLTAFPDSPKRASLLLNLASIYRKNGMFTKALAAWEESWNAAKNQSEPMARAIADQALAELASFTVTLGRTAPLKALLDQARSRDIGGSASEKISRAKEALWDMQNNPAQAFKCGPFSLYRMRHHLNLPNPVHQMILDEPSTTNGTSLAQMWDLSERMGMNLQMAKRQPGAKVLTPSMVYWKLGHFSALVSELNDRYLAEDTTFAEQIWLTRETLDAEAAGYFLVPAGQLPAGWTGVSLDEAKTIWGRMTPTSRDPKKIKNNDKKFPCDNEDAGGMARYSVHGMQVSLNIVDVPLSYAPPRGPAVEMRVTYNQRESAQPAVFNYSNLGPKWTFDWLSYVTDDPAPTTNGQGFLMFSSSATTYSSGGGGEGGGSGGGAAMIPPENGDYVLYLDSQSATRMVLKRGDPPAPGQPAKTTYHRVHADGRKEVYDLDDGSTNYPRRIYMTAIVDPHGNTVSNVFDANFRIVAVKDAIGQVSTVEYGSTNITNSAFYKIAKVTDPFGRYSTFNYNTNGQLTNITDVIGLSSSFTYTNADFITSMRTPYGITTFTNFEDGLDRFIEIAEPDGEKRRIEYKNNAPGIAAFEPAQLVPTGLLVTNLNRDLNIRNTFYWDKKAMREAPGDYTKAHMVHWLYEHDSFYVVSGIPESEKKPLENRVWYNYHAQPDARMAGTNAMPTKIARVLDDGTTQIQNFEYISTFGQVTKSVDPIGRTMSFIRDTVGGGIFSVLGENLTEVRQGAGGGSQLLASFGFDYGSFKHVPKQAINASGHVTSFAYNTNGQLTFVTNALNELTTLNYDTNGYLTNITGAISGAVANFTYDSFGRARTVTESEGYTVTFDYDALDRLTKVTYPDGTFEQTVYDKLDPILQKDRRGHWSRTIYNAVRQPTAIEDALGRVTQFDWCGCGGLASLIDPLGRVTSWNRDIQGRVTSKVYPDSTQNTFAFEKTTSRLRAVTDAKNQTTLYGYFGDNNLQQVTYSNAVVATPGVSFTYDTNFNRLVTMVDGIGTNVYSYYPITNVAGAGRLQSIDGSLANDTITYAYDELGRVTSRAIDGVAQAVTYDGRGRVIVMTNVLGRFTNNYVNTTFRLSSVFYPNGQSTVFNYFNNTNNQRPEEFKNLVGTNMVSKFNYTYDSDGQIQTWTQQADNGTPKTWVMNYDPVDQLLGVTVRSNGITGAILKRYVYGYDTAGNRTSEQIDLGVTKANYNNLNQQTNTTGGGPVRYAGRLDEKGTVQLDGKAATIGVQNTNFVAYADTALGTNTITLKATDYSNNTRTNKYQLVVTNNGVAKTLSYDLNGNLTNAVTATSTNSYEWDAANRLIKIIQRSLQNPTQLISEFTYDGLGRRVRIIEKTNGVTQSDKRFQWCDASICEERDSTGGNIVKRFLGLGEQISGTNYFFITDHLGSLREITDETGTIRARYEYDPYGKRAKVSGDLEVDFAFTGHYFHAPSGLHLTLYRAYEVNSGRWLSRDPMEELSGINLYGYVGNSPISFIDPYGLFQTGMFIRGAVGAVVSGVGIVVGYAAATTGVGTIPGGALGIYSSYQFGANVGNMFNAFGDGPAGPSGPAEAIVTAATDDPDAQNCAKAADLAIPLALSFGASPQWSRLPTAALGRPGTIAGAVQRVPGDPNVVYPFLKAFQYADGVMTVYESWPSSTTQVNQPPSRATSP